MTQAQAPTQVILAAFKDENGAERALEGGSSPGRSSSTPSTHA